MLRDADLSLMRAAEESAMDLRVTVRRSPMASAGQVIGPPLAIKADLPLALFPAARDGRLLTAIGLVGERAEYVALAPWGSDIRAGDELVASGRVLLVLGVAIDWPTVCGIALSEVRQ